MTSSIQIDLPAWGRELLTPARYKAVFGGRAAAKSWTVARLLLLLGMEQRIRIVCMRETQKSIAESSKQVLEDAIRMYDLSSFWDVRRDWIRGINDSIFHFRGMNDITSKNVRSLEGVNHLWFEEAQYMSDKSREILYPTIRMPGSELWFTFNPRYRNDPVYRDFCLASSRQDEAVVIKVNYDDNPWLPAEMERERLICERDEPDRYAHIWLGEPDDEGEARKVLPYAMLQACVEAWHKIADKSGRIHVGLDVADTGAACNAMVARRGPAVMNVESWSGGTLGDTTRRADACCRDNSASRLYYDVGGVGAGVRSHLAEMGSRSYAAYAVHFGGAVEGADSQYSRGVSNRDFFSRRNAQLAWALRLRAQRTQRLLAGEDAEPAACLIVDPGIPQLERYMTQLSQPEWKENVSGKIVIEKQPEGAASPDLYDATALAFTHDTRYGVRYG